MQKRMPAVILAVLCFGAFVPLQRTIWHNPSQRLVRRASRDLMASRWNAAERNALAALEGSPNDPIALLIAGQAALHQERDEDAIHRFLAVGEGNSEALVEAWYRVGERLMRQGRAADAEKYLRAALQRDPAHLKANSHLAELLQYQGRSWESFPYLRRELLAGHVAKSHVIMLGALDTAFSEDYQFVENCLAADPSNRLVLLGRARLELANSQFDRAESTLREIVSAHPESVEAQARLGTILFSQSSDEEFLDWHRGLPARANEHPEIWHVRGQWARRSGQLNSATRCFLETLSLDPNHGGATFQLSQLLHSDGHTSVAEELAERSQKLSQLRYLLMELRFSYDTEMVRKAVELLDELDRPLEAAGWCLILEQWQSGHEGWARERRLQLHGRLAANGNLTLAAGKPTAEFDREAYPLPDYSVKTPSTTNHDGPQLAATHITFANSAESAGVDFQYFNGTTTTTGLEHILQATGGGVGVLDFDLDGWPDIYFTQSGPFPVENGPSGYSNCLYRNLGNGDFTEVGSLALLNNSDFSQGVAVGDFDNDGFPDVYVANFGGNRLYRNMGDGTFTDVTQAAGVAGNHWTTSCMIADLNGDGAPEIYAVSYALMDEVLTMKCKHEGRPRTCAPTLLTADQDQLFQNMGDGQYTNVTSTSGIVAPDGKGLGIVAADFQDRGKLDVFVANDTSANFLFRNESSSPTHAPAFREQAIVTGVAYDEIGNLQACMGVAAGDANGDELLDLFVTNFYAESNVLYQQNVSHSFIDATRQANLRDPSFHQLGFGTQFIDADLDGWQDLIIANGHIDLTFAHGNPDRMPPQYLRNAGHGRFVELSAADLGEYFQGRYFGRALAKLDWNRDGREDVCISHLDAPAALLTNSSSSCGNYLAVQLRGTTSSRDAIGARVTVQSQDRRWTQHLIGGDGYHVSNQRQLVFGLGDIDSIDRISIRWPSGMVQEFSDVQVNQGIVLIEGRDRIRVLARAE